VFLVCEDVVWIAEVKILEIGEKLSSYPTDFGLPLRPFICFLAFDFPFLFFFGGKRYVVQKDSLPFPSFFLIPDR